jgi:hypothetical protein
MDPRGFRRVSLLHSVVFLRALDSWQHHCSCRSRSVLAAWNEHCEATAAAVALFKFKPAKAQRKLTVQSHSDSHAAWINLSFPRGLDHGRIHLDGDKNLSKSK